MTAAKMKMIRAEGGEVRVFAGGQTVADVDKEAIPAKDIVREPSIIVKSRGHIGFTYYERPFTHKAELWSYTLTDPDIDQKFVYYYLLTKVDHFQEVARATSVKLPQLGVRDTDSLPIPVPPLEVQREIVRILDHFTELEAELEAELESRRRQYAHYRDRMVAYSSSDVRWIPLGDAIGNLDSQRRPVTRSDRSAGAYPYYGANGVQDYVENYLFDGTFLLVGEDGSVVQKTGAPVLNWATGKIWVNNHAHVLVEKSEEVRLRFVFHYLQTIDISSYVTGGTQPKLNQGNMNRIAIPVPPVDEQERVIEVLDKFDALVNDLSIGLPAELAARRKQYECYRDKLLTFEEAPA